MILSLFSGAGGLDLGFEKAGFEIDLAFDIRRSAIDTYNYNRQQPRGFVRDIRHLNLADIDALFGAEYKPIGVIGGPPCQSFSVSNVTQKVDDARHDLPFCYASLLKQLNKRNPIHFFLFENVLGLKGKKHLNRYNKFKDSFKRAGFNIHELVLDALDFEVPQNRKRLFILGLNKKLYRDSQINIPISPKKTVTVRDVLDLIPEPVSFEAAKNLVNIPFHPNHWCMTPKSKKFSTPGSLIPGKALGRSFRVLTWDKPSPTVAYGNREVHIHPNCKRRLSVYEAMLLQGFPKTYEFRGTMSSQFQQVSEAVPPGLAYAIAKQLRVIYKTKKESLENIETLVNYG